MTHMTAAMQAFATRTSGLARRVPATLAAVLVCVGASFTSVGALAQAAAPTVFDVKRGDTFSAIAGQVTGDPRTWRQLYDAARSGLPNPNLITVGTRLELVTEASGARYLRLVGAPAVAAAPTARAAPRVETAAAANPVSAPTPAPAPQAAAVPPVPDAEIVLGVLPNVAAPLLLAQYEHMKRYLERGTSQKVRVVVPANFKAFVDSSMRGEYDLAVSAPHFARMAQLDRNMVPVVTYEPRISALFITPQEGGIANVREVREKAIAFANPQSLVAMYGTQWLRQNNLEAGKDFEAKAARTDMGVGRMLLTNEAAAAIMSNGEMRALPPDEGTRLKVVEVFARIPNFIVMANSRMPRDRVARIKTQLKAFFADAEDGAAFAKATGFTGIVDIEDAQMRELDPFMAQTRRAMGYAP